MASTVYGAPQPTAEVPSTITYEPEKHLAGASGRDAEDVNDKADSINSTEHKQQGVKQVEAITTVWSKQLLIVMFILLYFVSFIDAMLQSVQSNLIPYVTSSFSQHGLLATTGIVATILGGVCQLSIAKVIDIWGRCEGFAVMLILTTVGVIMKAACINVQMYAAAHTFYWVGHLGMTYVITIILADITSLRNRAIMFGINGTPTIATTFGGPRIAELFYKYVNFRWAFGAFIIMEVAFCLPIIAIFVASKRKAIKLGKFPEQVNNGRSFLGSIKYYLIEFDVVGMFLTIFGWSLLLLPFSLVYTAPNGWKTGYLIAMIVLGVFLLALFVVWEKYFATVQYFPFRYLKDRTILGACLLYGIMFISIFIWDAYYGSYLQVVHDQSITISGYVLNSFSLMASFWAPFCGFIIRYTGNYKWVSIAGVPVAILGTALLIHFRTPETHIGLLVMCQLLNGLATGTWALCAQIAIMASVTHQEIAVSLALFGLFGSIGASIGFAIAGGIWTNTLPQKLYEFLPEDSKNLTAIIYGDIEAQKSYPLGTPIRDAVVDAYADVQRKMVIAGSCVLPLCLVCLLMWRNINVKELERTRGKQTKGNVW